MMCQRSLNIILDCLQQSQAEVYQPVSRFRHRGQHARRLLFNDRGFPTLLIVARPCLERVVTPRKQQFSCTRTHIHIVSKYRHRCWKVDCKQSFTGSILRSSGDRGEIRWRELAVAESAPADHINAPRQIADALTLNQLTCYTVVCLGQYHRALRHRLGTSAKSRTVQWHQLL